MTDPLFVVGTSAYPQLPQIVAAVRSAPPVGRWLGWDGLDVLGGSEAQR